MAPLGLKDLPEMMVPLVPRGRRVLILKCQAHKALMAMKEPPGHKALPEMMVLLVRKALPVTMELLGRKDRKANVAVMVLLGRKALQVPGHQILA